MIKENKVIKYLLYAIGEIVLVVIGILIALQINNQNEFRKQKLVEINISKMIIRIYDTMM
jgi:sensor domain CHASE-containing protein